MPSQACSLPGTAAILSAHLCRDATASTFVPTSPERRSGVAEGDWHLCRTASSGNLQSSARECLIADPSSRTSERAKLYKEEALQDLVAMGASQDSLEQLKDSLTPLVNGLRRTGRLGAVQASFRDATSQSTKSIVR